MLNFYVIGSIKQANEIKEFSEYLKFDDTVNVEYVGRDEGISYTDEEWIQKRGIICEWYSKKIEKCFYYIEKADIVFAVSKPDYTFGDGVMYEMEYAKRIGEKVVVYYP